MESTIEIFLSELGVKNIIDYHQMGKCLKNILLGKKDAVIVSKSKIMKKMATVRGIEAYYYPKLLQDSKRFLAFKDVCLLLASKNIPVFFYNRVGKEKNGFEYSASAIRRMNKGSSFPKMYQNIDSYELDFIELFGDKYSKDYVEEIGKIPQVIKIDNLYCHEDCRSKYVNVVEGKRITLNQPETFKRTIHVFGRCGAFGYAVEDGETIPSQIQKKLQENGIDDIKVINHGLWGGEDSFLDHNFFIEAQKMQEGDIVLFYRFHFLKPIIHWLEKNGMWYKEITDEYHKHDEAKWCFYDKPGHMNAVGYSIVADILVTDLIEKKFSAKEIIVEGVDKCRETKYLDQYLAENTSNDFEEKVSRYTDEIADKHSYALNGNNGGIVMNCNPFTYGHRYLIEYASKKVDYLFIFVVEEDKSFFKFDDRYEMVVEGTKDLENVIVVPSGKFIISSYTFPEYFMKDYVKEKNFDVSGDVNIFCKYIAPKLSIKERFVGEEPFDPVTANYNETMKRIFPEYSMKLVEIKRKALNDQQVINATEVRKLLKGKKYAEILQYVPQSTYKILKDRYFQ